MSIGGFNEGAERGPHWPSIYRLKIEPFLKMCVAKLGRRQQPPPHKKNKILDPPLIMFLTQYPPSNLNETCYKWQYYNRYICEVA